MSGFLAYIPAGYPDLKTTRSILKELDGLPITGVEIGVPFSDPVADGPVIQMAHQSALKQGVNLDAILDMIESLSLSYDLYLMSYLNPLMNYPYGTRSLERRLKKAGVRGLIIPDLPFKEMAGFSLIYPKIIFIAPNTPDKDITMVNKACPPFVYYVARYGVTGTHKDLPFMDRLKELKGKIKAPFYVGFGVSTAQQVKALNRVADGVIVGSLLVKEIASGPIGRSAERVAGKVKMLICR